MRGERKAACSIRRDTSTTIARYHLPNGGRGRPRPARCCYVSSARSGDMSNENRALTTAVAKIIEAQRDEPRINPSSIATAALLELDPKKKSLPVVLAGCHLALRQIARALLRKHF